MSDYVFNSRGKFRGPPHQITELKCFQYLELQKTKTVIQRKHEKKITTIVSS